MRPWELACSEVANVTYAGPCQDRGELVVEDAPVQRNQVVPRRRQLAKLIRLRVLLRALRLQRRRGRRRRNERGCPVRDGRGRGGRRSPSAAAATAVSSPGRRVSERTATRPMSMGKKIHWGFLPRVGAHTTAGHHEPSPRISVHILQGGGNSCGRFRSALESLCSITPYPARRTASSERVGVPVVHDARRDEVTRAPPEVARAAAA